MPIADKKGGTFKVAKTNNPNDFLCKEQAEFVYKKVNTKAGINFNMIKQEMAQSKLITEHELDNTYKKAILAEVSKEKEPAQIEEWSILSDLVKYIMHDESEAFHRLNIDTLNYRQNKDLYKELKEKELLDTCVNFGKSLIKLKSDYLDVYEGIYAEVISTDRFDDDTGISTTYLGPVDMTRGIEVKAEESFPITARGYTRGQLLDGTDCKILVNTGASKSYMLESSFLRCKNLHAMPKFTSTTRIQVGNGQYVGALFVIPVIITIQKHRFEIFTLVSEIHENVDLVLGIKNLFELEGVIDSWDPCLSFLYRSIPFFPSENVELKPKK